MGNWRSSNFDGDCDLNDPALLAEFFATEQALLESALRVTADMRLDLIMTHTQAVTEAKSHVDGLLLFQASPPRKRHRALRALGPATWCDLREAAAAVQELERVTRLGMQPDLLKTKPLEQLSGALGFSTGW